MAIDHARDLYTRRLEGISIWVVPSKQITASDPPRPIRCSSPHATRSTVIRPFTRFRTRSRPCERRAFWPSRAGGAVRYVLRLGDLSLVLGQRLGEWVGHAPALEEDLGLANVALDLIGQARLLLSYAGELEGLGRDEDDIAFLREQVNT